LIPITDDSIAVLFPHLLHAVLSCGIDEMSKMTKATRPHSREKYKNCTANMFITEN